MPRRSRVKITPSTGNVFRDLGFTQDRAQTEPEVRSIYLDLQAPAAFTGTTTAPREP